MYFPEDKLVIKLDEKKPTDRKKSKEEERANAITKFVCKIIRINSDREDYDECVEFSKMINYINESNEKLTEESSKKSLKEHLSKRRLKLEFKSNHSIKSECLKHIVEKYWYHYNRCKLSVQFAENIQIILVQKK